MMANLIDFGGHSSNVKVTMGIIDKFGVLGDATLCVVIFELSFPERAMSFLDFSPWITFGTFSILLSIKSLLTWGISSLRSKFCVQSLSVQTIAHQEVEKNAWIKQAFDEIKYISKASKIDKEL